MHDFCYVSKKEAAPVKAELLDIIHEVQDIVRDDFTFQFTFIGSSSRNMITYDRKSNIGFDFDINIEVNDDDENYEPKEIRTIIRKALDKVASIPQSNTPPAAHLISEGFLPGLQGF